MGSDCISSWSLLIFYFPKKTFQILTFLVHEIIYLKFILKTHASYLSSQTNIKDYNDIGTRRSEWELLNFFTKTLSDHQYFNRPINLYWPVKTSTDHWPGQYSYGPVFCQPCYLNSPNQMYNRLSLFLHTRYIACHLMGVKILYFHLTLSSNAK